MLLVEQGADVDYSIPSTGLMALLTASLMGHDKCLSLLLRHKANINNNDDGDDDDDDDDDDSDDDDDDDDDGDDGDDNDDGGDDDDDDYDDGDDDNSICCRHQRWTRQSRKELHEGDCSKRGGRDTSPPSQKWMASGPYASSLDKNHREGQGACSGPCRNTTGWT